MKTVRDRYFYGVSTRIESGAFTIWRFNAEAERSAWVEKYPKYRAFIEARHPVIRKANRDGETWPVEVD